MPVSSRIKALLLSILLPITLSTPQAFTAEPATAGSRAIFAPENLVAWCVVPFDASKRGPAERAEMLQRLGFKKLAYDWRQEHVPTFEQEILELKKHGIEFFAFWSEHEEAFRLFEKHRINPQIWKTAPSPKGQTQEERVENAAKQLLPLVERARQLNAKLGLYNHGGWGGQPENLVAVCQWLKQKAATAHVGIIYNFHHGHEHLERFPEAFNAMIPHLLCVNLNGMMPDGPKILAFGQGNEDLRWLKMIYGSGYRGPIGILDHRNEVDAEESLKQSLEGLRRLLQQINKLI